MRSSRVLRFVSYALLVYGAYEIFGEIWRLLQGDPPSGRTGLAALGSLAAAGLLLRYLPRLLESRLLRKLGIQPRSHVIDSSSDYRVDVQSGREARVSVDRDYVFLERPRDDDLADLCLSSQKVDFAGLGYQSPDAKVITSKKYRGCNVAVYWQPKSSILPLEPYKHSYSWRLISNLGEARNYWQYKPVARTGRHRLRVQCLHPPIKVVALRRPWWCRITGEAAVYRYADKADVTHCPQPEIAGNTITWEILNPAVGRDYYIVWGHQCAHVDPETAVECDRQAVTEDPLRCEEHHDRA